MLTAALGFASGLAFSSLVEYAVHRAAHCKFLRGSMLHRAHMAHHVCNQAQPWWRESLDYSLIALALCWPPFSISVEFGAGWCAAAFCYAVAAGYCHWRHHQSFSGLGWHRRHHRRPSHDFGVITPFWDVVFGTMSREVPPGYDPTQGKEKALEQSQGGDR